MNKIIKLLILLPIFLSGCQNGNTPSDTNDSIYLARPSDTNLEFWITEKVDDTKLEEKGCTYLPGWMGASEYLDSRYEADTSEAMAKAPDIHVTYLLTGYPDLLDDPAVTHIEITDPSITVYGLSIGAKENAIISRLSEIATSFSFNTTLEECYLSVHINRCTFSFKSDKITISASTTNNSNIIY